MNYANMLKRQRTGIISILIKKKKLKYKYNINYLITLIASIDKNVLRRGLPSEDRRWNNYR